MGSEHEIYATKIFRPNGIDFSKRDPLSLFDLKYSTVASDLLEIKNNSDLNYCGEFIKNGGRMYEDLDFFLECSTPECKSALELVKYEKAFDRIVHFLRMEYEREKKERILVTRNNTSPDGRTFGAHENYLIKREALDYREAVRTVLPHLLTRIIYTGSGEVLVGGRGSSNAYYVISPRAMVIERLISGSTTEKRAFFNTRDEPHARNEFFRIHGITPDANMQETAAFLKYFTTSKIWKEVEFGGYEPVEFKIHDPISEFRKLSMNYRGGWRIETTAGTLSPIEIQRMYLESIRDQNIETREDRFGIKLWDETLQELEGWDWERMKEKLDWPLKLDILRERAVEFEPEDQLKASLAISQQYHEVSPRRSFYWKEYYDGNVNKLLREEDIKEAVFKPPETRAKVRTFIPEEYVVDVDWGLVKTEKSVFFLDDPRSSRIPVSMLQYRWVDA